MLEAILLMAGIWFLAEKLFKSKPKTTTTTTTTIIVNKNPQLLTAQAVIDQIIKKYNKTQNAQELHVNFDQWLTQVMQQFNEYEVTYLVKRALQQALPLEPSKINSFNEFHKKYGAYVIAYNYELN